ncbi:hypothetical protein [Photorhabdus sp. RM71S]|uniref:hypothetical protein n=1 Tax=Photorhabdus sp. RM71S TaxID=3342824 RepID=UPI0036DE9C57
MKTLDYFAQLRSQLAAFTFLNGDGLTVSRLGLSITLFFKQGYTQEKTILNYLRNQSCGIPHRHFCNKQGIPSVRYIPVIFQVAS